MATLIERLWSPTDTSHLSSKDKKPGRYLAYVPNELPSELPAISAEANALSEQAHQALIRADERLATTGGFLNHLLIRSEAISSSWIEGNRVSGKRVALAEVLGRGDATALAVLQNVRQTENALKLLGDPETPLTVRHLEELHHTISPDLSFGLRTVQNWVGGTGWSPLRADFVPPPENEVPRLVANLAEFASATGGNPVIRAAVAHAQFETIHPFTDGNGRTGRALIHAIFARTQTLRHSVLPISRVLASKPESYIAGLGYYRETPSNVSAWVSLFSEACIIASGEALTLADEVDRITQENWKTLVAHRTSLNKTPVTPRRDAVVRHILGDLQATPVLTVSGVSTAYGVTAAAALRALQEIADAGILRRTKDHKGRLVAWSADSYLALTSRD